MSHDTETMAQTTLQNIQNAGKKEFLEKGFAGASLRNIVKEAGVTTGAFYGYYHSKEDLFDALVSEHFSILMEKFKEAQDNFANLPPEEQPDHMGSISGDCMDWMVEYIYEHMDAFRLLLCHARGTKYENLIHEMVEIEVKGTHDFIAVLRSLGQQVPDIDPQLEHILVSGMFSAFFEMVIHDMTKEQALNYTRELRIFYTAGWAKIMGLDYL